MTTIEITAVSGTELRARRACVTLDAARGVLTARAADEAGGSVPTRVYHGHVLRWTIPALKAAAANELLEELAPLAQRVCDGYASVWNGRDHVAEYLPDAMGAREQIAARCLRAGEHESDVLCEEDTEE